LKRHIRTEKLGLKTGDSDDASGKVSLQPSDMLDIIKAGNPHAKRNVLARQELIMSSVLASNKENAEPVATSPSPSKKIKTKAQTLSEQASSISKISDRYEESTKAQQALIKHQTDLVQPEKLKQALNLGLLMKEQFDRKARAILLQP
jgi:hypothetical protein